ncbi:MAG: hypothetical protein JXB85_12890 [Anaerolineales bacterium]|nr:hypothetical protein [Anaerolineales bacterium]
MKPGVRCLVCLSLALVLLAACDGLPLGEGYRLPTPADAQLAPLATPTRIPESPDTLVVCLGAEPTDLFLYSEPTYEKLAILAAIYDGPIDRINYTYQPVILEKIPSLADGDALIQPVTVEEGELVIDTGGQMAPLLPGLLVRPAGCRSDACAVAFEGGTLEMDHLRVTFHLQQGILWSDGTPLTAHDSVFSYRVAVSEWTAYGLGGLVSRSAPTAISTAAYTAEDEHTVVWTGLPGFMDPTYQANFFIPLPAHTLARFPVEVLLASDDANRTPLGWGPYRLTTWEPGAQIILERNPNYFRSGEGLPYFDRLVFRFQGRDLVANLTAIQSGACDILLADALPEVPTPEMLILVEAGAARLVPLPGLDGAVWEALTFGVNSGEGVPRPDFFDDPRLRHAAAYCLDRQAMADAIYLGTAPLIDTYLPTGHPLLVGAQVASYPYQPESGMALLDDLGWRDEDADGIREAHGVTGIAEGVLLQFTLTTTDSGLRLAAGQAIAADLAACGMDVALVQAPGRELFVQDSQALLAGRRFDLALFSTRTGWVPPCALGMTSAIPAGGNAWAGENLSGYVNPAYDAACALALDSLPGTPEYVTAHQEALRIYSADLPVLPLFVQVYFMMTRPELSGLSVAYTQGSELIHVETLRREP